MGAGFRKPRSANKLGALHPGWGAPSFFPQSLGLFRKTFVEGIDLFETPPFLHGALLSVRGRRERNRAFTSQIKATYRAVMVY
jgi:hypothetical protein